MADDTLRNWYPEQYQAVTGIQLTPETSCVLRERAFRQATQDKLVVVAGYADWHPKVPRGMVGVVARRGGRLDGSAVERYFLVERAEYTQNFDSASSKGGSMEEHIGLSRNLDPIPLAEQDDDWYDTSEGLRQALQREFNLPSGDLADAILEAAVFCAGQGYQEFTAIYNKYPDLFCSWDGRLHKSSQCDVKLKHSGLNPAIVWRFRMEEQRLDRLQKSLIVVSGAVAALADGTMLPDALSDMPGELDAAAYELEEILDKWYDEKGQREDNEMKACYCCFGSGEVEGDNSQCPVCFGSGITDSQGN